MHLVNQQERNPLVPVYDMSVSVCLDGKQAIKAQLVPNSEELDMVREGEYVNISIPKLDVYHMITIDYIED